jgi:hypothetical protein
MTGSSYAEPFCQLVDLSALDPSLHELLDLLLSQLPLRSARRSDRSRGHRITPVTSDDAEFSRWGSLCCVNWVSAADP